MRITRRLALGVLLLAASAAPGDAVLDGLEPLHSGALRVYLVRHAQALSNLDPTPALPPDELDHLSELGARQAEALADALAGRGISAVFCSPAMRARETASVIARKLGLGAPVVDPHIAPLELGHAPDGRTLSWDERVALWQAGSDPSPPGGESLERVGERVRELVRALARSRRGASVVLVAHSEVLGAYLGRVRGTPPHRRHPFGLANGSVSVVDVMATGAESLRLANLLPVLP